MRVPIIAAASILMLCTCAAAQTDLQSADAVKEYYSDWLSSIPGVTNVDVGNSQKGTPEIEVHASVITNQIRRIPPKLNGIPVAVFKDGADPDEPSTQIGTGKPQEGSSAAAAGTASPDQSTVNNSVGPSVPTAPTMPPPTAPTAINPLETPQEGQPPQPEGTLPPGIR
jgi:hypothetical protein